MEYNITELKKAGFKVEELADDYLISKGGRKFKLWVGQSMNAHICIRDVVSVEIEKEENPLATYNVKPFRKPKHLGTIFDVKNVGLFAGEHLHLY